MKRLLSAALAFSLIGSTAAFADPYGHAYGYGNHGYGNYGYSDRDYRYRRHNDNGGAIVFGLGVLTLAAVLASQHHEHDGWYDRDRGYYRGDDGYYRDGNYRDYNGYGY
jgi:Ni/Co efflux regulator RcnB